MPLSFSYTSESDLSHTKRDPDYHLHRNALGSLKSLRSLFRRSGERERIVKRDGSDEMLGCGEERLTQRNIANKSADIAMGSATRWPPANREDILTPSSS